MWLLMGPVEVCKQALPAPVMKSMRHTGNKTLHLHSTCLASVNLASPRTLQLTTEASPISCQHQLCSQRTKPIAL